VLDAPLVEHDARRGHVLLAAVLHDDDFPLQDVEHVRRVRVVVGTHLRTGAERERLHEHVVRDDEFLGEQLAGVRVEVGIAVHTVPSLARDLSVAIRSHGAGGLLPVHAPPRTVFPETLTTGRLRFERLCREYVPVDEYYTLVGREANPTVEEELRYIPRGPVETVGAAADRLEEFERRWDARERAEYALRPRDGEPGSGDLAGTAGLIFAWDRRLAKLAVRLRKRFWGRGYSGERADALLELAFDSLDLDCVAIPVHAGNERSRRAVESYVDRWNGRHEGLLRNDGARSDGPVDRHRFTVTHEEYDNAK
jgi:ribosomal-protein-alanine N-acetyltransferase